MWIDKKGNNRLETPDDWSFREQLKEFTTRESLEEYVCQKEKRISKFLTFIAILAVLFICAAVFAGGYCAKLHFEPFADYSMLMGEELCKQHGGYVEVGTNKLTEEVTVHCVNKRIKLNEKEK